MSGARSSLQYLAGNFKETINLGSSPEASGIFSSVVHELLSIGATADLFRDLC